MDHQKFERKPQRHQLFIEFKITMKHVLETLEIADIGMTKKSSPITIDTIVNINFGRTFHHQNGPRKNYHTDKHTGYKNQPRKYH